MYNISLRGKAMKLNHILSNELPEIDQSIKECVNLGQWLLFKSDTIENADADVAFYLKAGPSVFELDVRGQVLKTLETADLSLHIDELFYFSDIPQPCSLSNMSHTLQ